jgi:hypothetical protein
MASKITLQSMLATIKHDVSLKYTIAEIDYDLFARWLDSQAPYMDRLDSRYEELMANGEVPLKEDVDVASDIFYGFQAFLLGFLANDIEVVTLRRRFRAFRKILLAFMSTDVEEYLNIDEVSNETAIRRTLKDLLRIAGLEGTSSEFIQNCNEIRKIESKDDRLSECKNAAERQYAKMEISQEKIEGLITKIKSRQADIYVSDEEVRLLACEPLAYACDILTPAAVAESDHEYILHTVNLFSCRQEMSSDALDSGPLLSQLP